MPYPTVDEFKTLLLNRDLNEIVDEHILDGLPFAFRNVPGVMTTLRGHLAGHLPIRAENVFVVGSAKLGFSLNPDGYFNPFTEGSDIDVVIVDEELFERVWMILLDWHFPRRYGNLLNRHNSTWAGRRQKDVYWGWIVPDKIPYRGIIFPDVLRPLRDISTQWFNAFQSLSHYPNLVTRTVNSRLYRTREHARRYHSEGLRSLREFLRGA